MNPQSRVPTLVHDGQRFTQSLAIIEYLDEMFHRHAPASQRPGGARPRAHVVADHRLRHSAAAEHQHHEIPEGNAPARRGRRLRRGCANGSRAASMPSVPSSSTITFRGKFCHGDTPSMADCCLVPQMFAADRFGVDPTHYPRLALICGELQRTCRPSSRASFETDRCRVTRPRRQGVPRRRTALAGLTRDGMTVMSGGFGLCGIPENLILALRDSGARAT